MALQDLYSGEFGTTNQYIKYYIEMIENWVDIAGNLSNITVRVWAKRTNGYESYGTGTVSVTIAGGAYSAGITTAQKINSNPIILFEKNLNIGHGSNGQGNVDIYASISHSVFSSGNNGWGFGLTTIARASTPTLSVSEQDMGAVITINTNRADASFTHTLVCGFGSQNFNIAFNVGTSFAWTLPLTLANEIPNDLAGWGGITCHTYSGGTLIGSKSVNFTARVPASVIPTLTAVTHSENDANVSTKAGVYVQNMTKLNLDITGAAGVYGSSISKYEITVDGTTYGKASVSNIIKTSGTLTITGKVTDSRGRTATKTASITVTAYQTPKVTTLTIQRSDSGGILSDMGTYAKVTRAVTWSVIGTKNTLSIVVKSRARGGSTWTTKNTFAAGTTGSTSGSVVVGTYAATTSHEFMIEFTDLFNTTISLLVLPTGQVTMSWGKTGIGIGKVWESGALDVQGDMNIDGEINATKGVGPVGSVQMWTTATAPIGYLLCQGQAISRTTYARLFAIIGTTYGTGDGSTTFNLPNLKGRVAVGFDSGQTEFNAIAKTGGEKGHFLTIAEMPSHNHASEQALVNAAQMGIAINVAPTGAGQGYGFGYNQAYGTTGTGGGGAHNNMQPFITMNYIIRY